MRISRDIAPLTQHGVKLGLWRTLATKAYWFLVCNIQANRHKAKGKKFKSITF